MARSWDAAAALFQRSISKPKWVAALANARQPLRSLISRKVISARYTRSLPGVPDGEYVVIPYKVDLEHKDSAIETITPLLEKDGSGRCPDILFGDAGGTLEIDGFRCVASTYWRRGVDAIEDCRRSGNHQKCVTIRETGIRGLETLSKYKAETNR